MAGVLAATLQLLRSASSGCRATAPGTANAWLHRLLGLEQTCAHPSLLPWQFLACNRDRYLVGEEEQVLIQGKCASGISLSSGAAPAAAAGLQLAAALGGVLAAAAWLLL